MKRNACALLTALALAVAPLTGLAQSAPAKKAPNPSAKAKGKFKKATWTAFHQQNGLKASGGRSAEPDPDCPPLPHEECLKTWE